MAQCEKTLDNRERCSNRAVPGKRLCKTHEERIVFRPLPTTDDSPPAPPLSPVPIPPAPVPISAPVPTPKPTAPQQPAPRAKRQNWQAIPSAAGQIPEFPGLHADEQRHILVAPEGYIWLQASAPDQRACHFNSLVKLMSFLSETIVLPGQVKLLVHEPSKDYLIALTPTPDATNSLSFFYDTAADAARLVNARLYIGQGAAFVQYRDNSAPRGYEVPKFKAPAEDKEILLIADWGTQRFMRESCNEIALADFCLQIAPVPAQTDEPLELVYALVPHALYALLSRYFHAHHLHYRIAHLRTSQAELMLFAIGPRHNAPIKHHVPLFILDHLSRLPGVDLLVPSYQAGDVAIFVPWRYRYPLHLPHVAGAFMAHEMILFIAEIYANMRIDPAPTFFDGDQLVDAQAPKFTAVSQTQPLASMPATLKVEILLRPDDGPIPPIAALVLSPQEMALLRYLLYRLPGDVFSTLSYCQGNEFSLLLGNGQAIEGIPFGTPLRRPGEQELFIPQRYRLVPDLPWSLLHDALALRDHTYTFLSVSSRLDLPESAFAPLSRALVAGPNQAQMSFNKLALTALPVLRWTPPEPPPPVESGTPKTRASSLLGNLGRRREQPATSSKAQPNSKQDATAQWRTQARTCEEAGDFLAAAVCYKFANDTSNSARCYLQASQVLRINKHEGE